jgi:hypothetical protein
MLISHFERQPTRKSWRHYCSAAANDRFTFKFQPRGWREHFQKAPPETTMFSTKSKVMVRQNAQEESGNYNWSIGLSVLR